MFELNTNLAQIVETYPHHRRGRSAICRRL